MVLSLSAEAARAAQANPQANPKANPGAKGAASSFSSADLLALILNSLEDDKAEDIVQIDLRGKSSIGDYMVVCSGRSSRQVAAIAEKMVQRVKDATGVTARSEGRGAGDWVLIDTGDVIVHVFRPEVREFYQLEKMWQPTGMAG